MVKGEGGISGLIWYSPFPGAAVWGVYFSFCSAPRQINNSPHASQRIVHSSECGRGRGRDKGEGGDRIYRTHGLTRSTCQLSMCPGRVSTSSFNKGQQPEDSCCLFCLCW